MNRAQRRGNRGAAGRRLLKLQAYADAVDQFKGEREQVARNMREAALLPDDTPKPAKVPKPAKEANQRPRAVTGRFAASGGALGVEVAIPPALTRQERRAQKRLVAKLAGGWGKVTAGAGVTLVDGVEVRGDA